MLKLSVAPFNVTSTLLFTHVLHVGVHVIVPPAGLVLSILMYVVVSDASPQFPALSHALKYVLFSLSALHDPFAPDELLYELGPSISLFQIPSS